MEDKAKSKAQLIQELEALRQELADMKQQMAKDQTVGDQTFPEERNLLRTLLDNLLHHIYVKDTDHQFVTSNLAHARMLGVDHPIEVLGKTDFDFFPLDLAAQYQADEKKIFQTGQPLINQEELTRDYSQSGRTMWVSITKLPVRDKAGEIIGLVGISRDITERKETEVALSKARDELEQRVQERTLELTEMNIILSEQFAKRKRIETELAKSKDFLDGVINAIPDPLFVKDVQRRYVLVNDAACRMLGCTREEIIDKLDTEFFSQEQATAFRERDDIVLKEGYDSYEEEVTNQDGKTFITVTVKSLYQNQATGEKFIVGIMRDITERKQAEIALQQAKEEAEAANKAKSIFLANMSHELRTPLNSILGFTQLMQYDATLTADQRQNLDIINRSGEHLLRLINDVLEMSKIEAGRTTLSPQNFDLHRLLDGLKEMFYLRAMNKNVEMSIKYISDVPAYIRTDEGKLRQVIINLLGNAIKFTEKGMIILRVGCDEEQAPENYEDRRSLRLLFEIEDTGTGIAPDELEHLFDAFVQTQAGRQSMEGTGLGLPISRQFIELMGGSITVESCLGKGSIFKFDVWVDQVDDSEVKSKKEPCRVIGLAPGQPKYRLLIAEDRWENQQLLQKLLEPLGFDIRIAANGQDCIEIWEHWKPHLIWMDIRMPVMDGYEATRYIKSTKQGQSTVIIALTASVLEQEQAIILAAGCDDFARKPFRDTEIFDMMSKHLGVKYLYAEEDGKIEGMGAKGKNRHLEQLTTEWLMNSLPPNLYAELQKAILTVDLEHILQLIEKIRSYDDPLAELLLDYVDEFAYDKILAVMSDQENEY